MNKKTILFSIIVLIVFIGTSIIALSTAKKITTINVASSDNPDFFMTNAAYTKFNQQGYIHKQVYANKITHFATNNVYLFDNPNMIMHTPNEQPWHITASKGRSEKGKDIIHLWDNVKVTKAADINNSDFDITTSALDIYPDIKFAQTDQPITIVQSGNTTNSVGAQADFKTGIVKLLSKVEGLYQTK
ncbi:MAG: hypothetical protein ACD_69C00160G0002 [uncultured bacterium]|nr:MAG: hypothetical protein ACD_69C00160G0002 [uncultured bacterium]OGT08513.1 MAG: LPS export ABC transporter periplasmic protein LptC [Gammaproteobacteria bacterium RBG_16_37_9]HBC71564.1 LPS export ABC transporter periplasmic protein LptC [Coxiellaceae bacterium]HBS52126.1 LPS export ABC transporter periplasmic protein LptC [Coxiellaceae bacterium]HBY55297.1 LPS export ABC transporter periplasmic protein LptC [Coxiellaceae bacterium]